MHNDMIVTHYETCLAEFYSWMFGDFDQKVDDNYQLFKNNGIVPRGSGIAVDLGGGPGFQSIALAKLGFRVTAIDLCRTLLDELEQRGAGLDIHPVLDDLGKFRDHVKSAEVIVCMGDTLVHLESFDAIMKLVEDMYATLETGGKCVITYRDLSHELQGVDRVIPVKSDKTTVMTAFLEYGTDHVIVNDIIYRNTDGKWNLKKSQYRKLRCSRDSIQELMQKTGFNLVLDQMDRGFVTLVGMK